MGSGGGPNVIAVCGPCRQPALFPDDHVSTHDLVGIFFGWIQEGFNGGYL